MGDGWGGCAKKESTRRLTSARKKALPPGLLPQARIQAVRRRSEGEQEDDQVRHVDGAVAVKIGQVARRLGGQAEAEQQFDEVRQALEQEHEAAREDLEQEVYSAHEALESDFQELWDTLEQEHQLAREALEEDLRRAFEELMREFEEAHQTQEDEEEAA